MTYVRLDTLAELLALWKIASAAERTAFLAHVVSGVETTTGGYPEHPRVPRRVELDGEGKP